MITERARIKEEVRSGKLTFDICVTTYESYVAEDTWFKSKQWTYIVLDEGHRIKNSDTNVAHKLQGVGSLYKLSKAFSSTSMRSCYNVFQFSQEHLFRTIWSNSGVFCTGYTQKCSLRRLNVSSKTPGIYREGSTIRRS